MSALGQKRKYIAVASMSAAATSGGGCGFGCGAADVVVWCSAVTAGVFFGGVAAASSVVFAAVDSVSTTVCGAAAGAATVAVGGATSTVAVAGFDDRGAAVAVAAGAVAFAATVAVRRGQKCQTANAAAATITTSTARKTASAVLFPRGARSMIVGAAGGGGAGDGADGGAGGAVRIVPAAVGAAGWAATILGLLAALVLVVAAGGALFAIARWVPFLADSVSYAFSTASLLLMRTRFQESREPDTAPLRRRFAEGVSFFVRIPFLRTTMMLIAVSNFTIAGVQLAVIVLAHRQGLPPAAIGGLVALTGATTLLGSIFSPYLRRVLPIRTILLSEYWAAAIYVAFLASPSVYVLAAALAAQAFWFPNTDSAVAGYSYALIPDRLLGRAMSVANTLRTCAAPLGPLAAGLLLSSVSPRLTVARGLSPDRLRREGVFRVETVERLRREHGAGTANHSHVLWALLVFEDWRARWAV